MLPPFTIERPTGLSEALGLLGEDSVPYWGGTELLLAMKMGLLRPRSLIDLKGLADLTGVRRDGDQLVVGAGVTHDDLARSPLVQELAPMLADMESRVGNARVRAQGSIGGNLCFAEPRSDVATVLRALDGSVRLASARGGRVLPIGDFVQGAYWTARADDEIVVDIRVPLPVPRGVYLKFQITERPAVAVAAVDRGAAGVRVVVGAVGEVFHSVDAASAADLDADEIAAAIEPVTDITGSARYKRHVTSLYVRRALDALEGAR
jgi:aerobic carbon-monoxide dehydrogenase medium subunit